MSWFGFSWKHKCENCGITYFAKNLNSLNGTVVAEAYWVKAVCMVFAGFNQIPSHQMFINFTSFQ